MSSPSIVVLISGGGTNLQAIIDACKLGDIQGRITGVISNKADAYGLTRAQNANIQTETLNHKDFDSRENYDQALIKVIDQFEPDLVVLAGFMRILTPAFVQHYQNKMLNIHPSLLPKYQGLNTHQRAIDAQDTEHGVSVHFVTEELDGGPVVLQAKVAIEKQDDADSLAQKIHKQEYIIYPKVINWFCQGRLMMVDGIAKLDDKPLSEQGHI